MLKMSLYMLYASWGSAAIASLLYLAFALFPKRVRVPVVANVGPRGSQSASASVLSSDRGMTASIFSAFAFAFLTLSLLFRTVATGHGPFSNMFEFTLAFAWGVLVAYLYVERRYRVRILGAVVTPISFVLTTYALSLPVDVQPLVPALQNNLLLTVHVTAAIVAYGTFAVGFGTALLYLLQDSLRTASLPSTTQLDQLGYQATIVGFPLMALVIILGAIWADVAWGTYWSWDPKETASLVTWLIYGAYLHARVIRGWRGTRSAILLIVGFVATLFTFFGSLIFGGLHSYL